jgi:hypothetical protein
VGRVALLPSGVIAYTVPAPDEMREDLKHADIHAIRGPVPERQLMNAVRRAARAIAAAYDPGGIAVWQNNGAPAHQTVPHAHFHVAGTLPGGGTRSGEVPPLDLDETDAITKRLSPHL